MWIILDISVRQDKTMFYDEEYFKMETVEIWQVSDKAINISPRRYRMVSCRNDIF